MAKNYKSITACPLFFSYLESFLIKYCKLAPEESYGVLNTFQGKRVLLSIVFQSSQTLGNLLLIST